MCIERIIATPRTKPPATSRLRAHVNPLRFFAVAVIACVQPSASAQEPLTLHDAVQRALSGPAVQITEAQVDEARGGVQQAALSPNPRIYLQSEDWRPWADNFSFTDQTEDYAYLGQLFEVAGKRSKRVAFANARLKQAQAARTLRLRQIAGSVTVAYWNAVSFERVHDLLRDDMKAVDEVVRYNKERVDAGAARGVDLLRVQIERDRLQIAFAAAERDATQARFELFRSMGQTPSDVRLTDTLDASPVLPPPDLDAVLRDRPDLEAARGAVAAAEADLKLQKANGVPDPDVLAGYKRNSADNTGYVSLQLPLAFRNRNQGEIARAQASVTVAQSSLRLLETQVRVEVEQARANYEAQQKIVQDTLPDMRSRARQNLEIINEAYRLGGADLLRFLDAERTEFDVEVSAVRTMAQLQQAAIQLQLVYGIQP